MKTQELIRLISKELQQLRVLRGISQERAAKTIGRSRTTVYSYEAGLVTDLKKLNSYSTSCFQKDIVEIIKKIVS